MKEEERPKPKFIVNKKRKIPTFALRELTRIVEIPVPTDTEKRQRKMDKLKAAEVKKGQLEAKRAANAASADRHRAHAIQEIQKLVKEWGIIRSNEKYELGRLSLMETWFDASYTNMTKMKWFEPGYERDGIRECNSLRHMIQQAAERQKNRIQGQIAELTQWLNEEDDHHRVLRSPKRQSFIEDLCLGEEGANLYD